MGAAMQRKKQQLQRCFIVYQCTYILSENMISFRRTLYLWFVLGPHLVVLRDHSSYVLETICGVRNQTQVNGM